MARKPILGVSLQNLFLQYKNGNIEARNKIIKYYMKKVEKLATDYYNLGLDSEDVLYSAYEGLIVEIAEIKYKNCQDPSKSLINKVESYIKQAIITFYGLKEEKIGLSNKLKNNIIKILKAKRDILKSKHKPASVEEISNYTNISINEVIYYLEIISKFESRGINYLVPLNPYSTVNPYQIISYENLKQLISSIINQSDFTILERTVIEERYLSSNQASLRQLATFFKCSIYNILKIERSAFRKIRNSSAFESYLEDSETPKNTPKLELKK